MSIRHWLNLVFALILAVTAVAPTVASADQSTRNPRVRVEGIVTALSTTEITVDTQKIQLTASTKVNQNAAKLEVGALVGVTAERNTSGGLTALEVEVKRAAGKVVEPIEFRGPISALPASGVVGQWTVGATTFQVTTTTRIEGTPSIGAVAEVHANRTAAGIVAQQIEVRRPAAQAQQVAFSGALSAFDSSRWVVAGTSVVISTTTRIEGTPSIGAVVEVRGLKQSDGTVVGQLLRVQAAQDREVEWRGEIQAMGAMTWTVGGRTVKVDAGTVVDEREGPAQVGAQAQVIARMPSDGTAVARRIRILRTPTEQIEFRGVIQSIASQVWVVSGITVSVTPSTVIHGPAQVGLTAEVKAIKQTSGSNTTLVAQRIEIHVPEAQEVEVAGTIDQVGSGFLVVSGITVNLTTTTIIRGQPQVGAKAEVSAMRQGDGSLLAIRVMVQPAMSEAITFHGIIESMTADTWLISGITIGVTTTTEIRGNAEIGRQVEGRAIRQSDGSLLAIRIEVLGGLEDSEVEFHGIVQRVETGLLVVSGVTVTLTGTTRIIGTPAVGARAEVHGKRQDDGSLLATRVVVASQSEEVEFRGVIQSFGSTTWVVQGVTVGITATTVVTGQPAVGRMAEVHAVRQADGSLLATRIVVGGRGDGMEMSASSSALADGTSTVIDAGSDPAINASAVDASAVDVSAIDTADDQGNEDDVDVVVQ